MTAILGAATRPASALEPADTRAQVVVVQVQ